MNELPRQTILEAYSYPLKVLLHSTICTTRRSIIQKCNNIKVLSVVRSSSNAHKIRISQTVFCVACVAW